MGRKSIPTRLPGSPRLGALPGITKMDRANRMTIMTRHPMRNTLYSMGTIPAILPATRSIILPGRLELHV